MLARAADHSELARLTSSLQQQMADTIGAHSLQIPQQRMPSLFGAPPQQAASAGHSVGGHVSSTASRPFVRASFGAATTSTPCGEAQSRSTRNSRHHRPYNDLRPAGPAHARPSDADSAPLTTSCTRSRRRAALGPDPAWARMQTEVGTPTLAGWLGGEMPPGPVAHFERYAAFARRPEVGHSQRAILSVLQDGWFGRIDQVMKTLALMAVAIEQASLDGGRWDLASLFLLHRDPPAHAVSRRETHAATRPFARLAEQGWATTVLAYIRELDLIEQRRSDLRNPRPPRRNPRGAQVIDGDEELAVPKAEPKRKGAGKAANS